VVARNGQAAVGGAGLSTCAALGMGLETDGGSFKAAKSWFAADGYLVALGAGIASDSDFPVETVIENRDLAAPAARVLAAGKPSLETVGREETFERIDWLHLDGYGGVALPGGATVRGLREVREGAWSRINKQGASPTDPRRRTYATFWFDHGTRPTAGAYAYVLLPGQTPAQTKAFNAATVVDNTAQVQAVRLATTEGVVHAANFWAPGRSGPIKASAVVSVVVRVSAKHIEIALADPTQLADQPIDVVIALKGGAVVSADPAAMIVLEGDAIRLTLDPRDRRGRAARIFLSRP
jgi:hyaluronate lyase